jgi:hypothetical protein
MFPRCGQRHNLHITGKLSYSSQTPLKHQSLHDAHAKSGKYDYVDFVPEMLSPSSASFDREHNVTCNFGWHGMPFRLGCISNPILPRRGYGKNRSRL